jgi:hypothetical protein
MFGPGRAPVFPSLPRGDEVARFETYAEAQQAVDRLVQADFPVQALSIIGNDMKSVERVTGRLSWGRAAGAGAVTGLWLGLFLGVLSSFFLPAAENGGLGYLFGAVLIGAAFGILYGVVSYALTRRRRDFSSVMQVLASSYSLIADGETANRARNVLGTGLGTPAAASAPVAPPPADDGPITPA